MSDTVRQFLRAWEGKRAFVPPILMDNGHLAGNHGDSLIEMGTEVVLRDLSIRCAASAEEADLIVIGGGGSMIDGFTSGPRMLKQLSAGFPDKPLVVLPSSYRFLTTSVESLLPRERAPVHLFCRERYSLDHLSAAHRLPPFVTLHLDHDMAFQLSNQPIVSSVLANREMRHVLIVDRWDVEHPDRKLNSSTGDRIYKTMVNFVPEAVRAALRPAVATIRGYRRGRVRQDAQRLIQRDFREISHLPVIQKDISLPRFASRQEFENSISHAAVVFTTRLHVGVLAGMCGVPTVLYEGGYWKARGVYELSMREMRHVQFRDLDEIERNKDS